MRFLPVLVLASGTYAFRLAGPLLRQRLGVPERVQRWLSLAAVALLAALVATTALTASGGFTGWSRPAGVLVGAAAAARRAPFVVVVVIAAGITALLRLAGAP